MNTQKHPARGKYLAGKEFDTGKYTLRRVISISSQNAVVAHVNCGFGDGPEQAAFIVEACNAHDGLMAEVARLRSALTAISNKARPRAAQIGGKCVEYIVDREHIDTARAALAGGVQS